MKKLKPNLALFITLFLLIIVSLFVKTAIYTYNKCFESEITRIQQHFAYIGETTAARINLAYERMGFETKSTARFLSDTGLYDEKFEHQYLDSNAQATLYLSAAGSFEYGADEYREIFGHVAIQAAESGETVTSEPLVCSDGEWRFAVAAPIETGGSVLLLFPTSAIAQVTDADLFDGKGHVMLISSDGDVVSQNVDAKYDLYYKGAMVAAINADKEIYEYKTRTGEKLFITLRPVSASGLYIACTVTEAYLSENASSLFTVIFGAHILAFVLLVSLTLFSVMLISLRNKKLRMARTQFDIVVKQSARATYQYDRKNNTFSIISGSEMIRLPGNTEIITIDAFLELVHPADRRNISKAIEEFEENGTTSVSVQVMKLGGTDEYRWYNIDATRLTQIRHGAELIFGSIEDIDERERERQILRQKATTDPLTGLYDRAETQRIINDCLANLDEDEHSTFCIIDLDNFKMINDLYGHVCGDRVLLFFSEKLKSTFRFGDIIGRLGGDEFMVYIALTSDRNVVERRFVELMDSLSMASLTPELPEVSCSVGYVTAKKGDTFESVYKRADEAMYKAKTAGKKRAVGQ